MGRPSLHQANGTRRGDTLTTTLHLPSFFSSATALVEDEAHHHLFKVKRLQTGERLRVVDGEGHARWAEITGIDKRAARLRLGEPAPANEPALAVEIFVAAPKPDRDAWLVEKVTEIGVVAIHFISTDREARSVEGSQLARLRRIAVSAVEQSCRSVVPPAVQRGRLARRPSPKRRGRPADGRSRCRRAPRLPGWPTADGSASSSDRKAGGAPEERPLPRPGDSVLVARSDGAAGRDRGGGRGRSGALRRWPLALTPPGAGVTMAAISRRRTICRKAHLRESVSSG